ncbi:retrovirus-related pol polyprotein from transposon TNT 1-94 [Tanacetum coccineum]
MYYEIAPQSDIPLRCKFRSVTFEEVGDRLNHMKGTEGGNTGVTQRRMAARVLKNPNEVLGTQDQATGSSNVIKGIHASFWKSTKVNESVMNISKENAIEWNDPLVQPIKSIDTTDPKTQIMEENNDGSYEENPNPKSMNKGSFVEILNFEKPQSMSKYRTLVNSEQVENVDVVLPLAAVTAAQQRYVNSFVGYFVGKNVVFPLVQNYVTNTWGKFGFQKVIKDEDGFLFFKFASLTGLEQVLEQRPWLIQNVPLILTKWSPNLVLTKDKVTKVPV